MPKHIVKNESKEIAVQILDNQGNALMQMPLSMCLKQKLLREIAIVFIKNKDNQFIFTKNKMSNPSSTAETNLWDIPIYADIEAHEFAEQAALRSIYQEFSLKPSNLESMTRIPITIADNRVLASIFIMKQTEFQEEKNQVYLHNKEVIFLKLDELEALISHSAELFSAELIWSVQAHWLK